MQYFRINISEACRCHLGVILFFLNLSIMVVCHATGAMGLFVKQEASSFGNFLVFYNTSSLFKLLLCLSLLFLLFHLVGAKICYDSAFYETRERFHSVLFYWLLAGVALVPLTVAAIIVLTAHQSMVVRGIGLGFKQAMKRYKIDTPMREYINRLQVEHQCCGATSISDWYRVSWVDTSNAAPINRLANSHFMESNGEFLPRWAPFSCCRQDIIGTPCESVALFFNPTKNKEWVQKSNIYSVDYLSEYEKYAALYKRVKKASKKPPQDVVRRGRAIVQNRRSTFDTFLREVTGHRDMKPPPSPSDEHSPRVDGKTETIRAMFEAQGVKVQSFPEELFSRLGKPPWQGRMAWSYDNVTTAESGNLDQLLRLDGRQEDSTLELLRWRSFNQAGCAEPIGRMARLAMRAADFLFVFVLVAQVWILTLTRYLQTSIDTAYRWGNPLLSAPGFLFNTSLPPRPDDYETLMQEGEEVLSSLAEDLDEDDFKVLVSPSWASSEPEDDTLEHSSASFTDLSGSSSISGEPSGDVGSETQGDSVSMAAIHAPLGTAGDGSGDYGDDDGEDEGAQSAIDAGVLGGQSAPVSRSKLAVRVSMRPVASKNSANRASAMRLQSMAVRDEQQTDGEGKEGEDEEGEKQQQKLVGRPAVKPKQRKTASNRETEKETESNVNLAKSRLSTPSSNKFLSGESDPKKPSLMQSSPQKMGRRPEKSSTDQTGPEKSSSRQSSSKKSSLNKSSQKESSPKKPIAESSSKKSSPKNDSSKKSSPKKASAKKGSPEKSRVRSLSSKKSSPKKASPKKSSPKKPSPKKAPAKKSSPKKSSPQKFGTKKASPRKSSPKKSSPKKSSPKKTKTKSAGKSRNKSKQKAKGHKTKSKKSSKKRNK